MAPAKQLCLLYAQYEQARASLLKTSRDAVAAIDKAITTKYNYQFGKVNASDAAGYNLSAGSGSQLLNAIESVAASVSETALGSLSKASASILELIFSEILKILLAAPTVVFSLVAIPQSQAIDACNKERIFLSKAQSNFNMILSIMTKWFGGQDIGPYYDQMRRALPLILDSIKFMSDMIIDLEGQGGADNTEKNSFFDEAKYRQIQSNLHSAISITKPYSKIVDATGIDAIIDANYSKIYKNLEKKINEEYSKSRTVAAKDYMEETSTMQQGNIVDEVRITAVKNKYSSKLNALSAVRKVKLAKAQSEAKVEATLAASNYLKAAGGISASFVFDMQSIGQNLEELYTNVVKAYINYKIS